ncbi:CBM35 domain-containing protein [Nonomuraea angiospora]|uniref:CBM35 domain-containing protein n=1 Tax=Nonomuraea angiospora TaxID=46172 RepID=UPI0029B7F250|nr:CBM35 domain-containing protein [Nonomuraea angiospora]MDX3102870.1 CBM35 domain-containing protein [Nonomuraea angiospora]
MSVTRRQLGALVGAAFLAPALPARPASAGTLTVAPAWKLMWAPDPAAVGLRAFETLEDDRADSHPAGQPHIYVEGDAFRFNMHTVDRDTSTDRQRQEVTGNRNPDGYLRWLAGETWRVTYSMYIPSSLKATTTFTHISQTKMPGTGTSPITVTSLRRVNGVQTIEHKIFESDTLVGRTELEPLHDKWIDAEYEIKIGDGGSGSVRWVLRSGGATLVDATKTGDTFLGDRVRPKWGIYRSLGDTSGSLQNCYLLLRDMRAYKQVQATATRLEAESATISQGVVESNHAGFSGAGFVNTDNVAGAYVEWRHTAAAAGPATLTVRYANGTGADRPADLAVNGRIVASGLSFPATGAWTTWASRSVVADLAAGANTIRLTAATAGGCPNLDYLEVVQ